ncbi:MAG: ATP synthase F1 subunit gamma [Paludibacteraceae bacterium]|nr:ATP synthase F1 subunit gamma [Paludibacteraceae bacterium]
MASLKEIRERIKSVSSTKKITSAMKMVSAAKLHKAEDSIARFLPYKNKLTDVLVEYTSSIDEQVSSPLSEQRERKHVTIVCISSNTGLCGTFNSNINKLLNKTLESYRAQGITEFSIIPIGKKISEQTKKLGFEIIGDYNELSEKPNYDDASEIAIKLVNDFLEKRTDEVVILYNHFKNAGVQEPTNELYLPMLPISQTEDKKVKQKLYFAEPDSTTFVNNLVPLVVRMRLYAALLDSNAAEHGARTTAMQVASDNAEKMIESITQLYNRARQDVITNELLDIVSGSEALKNS